MQTTVRRTNGGIVIATLGNYRLKRYPEGGDCREVHVGGIGWTIGMDEDFPDGLYRKLKRAMPRHWSMIAE